MTCKPNPIPRGRNFPATGLMAASAVLIGACLLACDRVGQPPSGTATGSQTPPTSSTTDLPSGLPVPYQTQQTQQTKTQTQTKSVQAVPSDGGTITFQNIGLPGWYPSPRDPASAAAVCDAYHNGTCCMARHEVAGDSLSPWNEELTLTLRGPMLIKQLAVYQPDAQLDKTGQAAASGKTTWSLASAWDPLLASASKGMAFKRDEAATVFQGVVGNKCLVDVSSDHKFACGPGSVPYCAASAQPQYYGWEGSKLILMLASMPHTGSSAMDNKGDCSTDKADNWYDAPWIGLSHGELIRAGKFGGCNCYAKDPSKWQLADGCGQFNVFEVVNDNGAYQNFDVFSTNFFAYHGYVGEGPCGKNCLVSGLDPRVDLIDKATSREAASGSVANPQKGPGTAFRRPVDGFRYFVILMDMQTRTVQIGILDPAQMPFPAQDLPAQISRSVIADLLALRLPGSRPLSIIRP
jgi:hypothetical protein